MPWLFPTHTHVTQTKLSTEGFDNANVQKLPAKGQRGHLGRFVTSTFLAVEHERSAQVHNMQINSSEAYLSYVDRKSTRLKLQSLMRISYDVFCLKTTTKNQPTYNENIDIHCTK